MQAGKRHARCQQQAPLRGASQPCTGPRLNTSLFSGVLLFPSRWLTYQRRTLLQLDASEAPRPRLPASAVHVPLRPPVCLSSDSAGPPPRKEKPWKGIERSCPFSALPRSSTAPAGLWQVQCLTVGAAAVLEVVTLLLPPMQNHKSSPKLFLVSCILALYPAVSWMEIQLSQQNADALI